MIIYAFFGYVGRSAGKGTRKTGISIKFDLKVLIDINKSAIISDFRMIVNNLDFTDFLRNFSFFLKGIGSRKEETFRFIQTPLLVPIELFIILFAFLADNTFSLLIFHLFDHSNLFPQTIIGLQ